MTFKTSKTKRIKNPKVYAKKNGFQVIKQGNDAPEY